MKGMNNDARYSVIPFSTFCVIVHYIYVLQWYVKGMEFQAKVFLRVRNSEKVSSVIMCLCASTLERRVFTTSDR